MNYEQNQKYFKNVNVKLFVVGIIIGIIVIGAGGAVPGVVILAATIGLYFLMTKGIPADSEIDRQVQAKVNELKNIALNKHGLSEESLKGNVLILGGYLSDWLGMDIKKIVQDIGNMNIGQLANAAVSAIEGASTPEIKIKKGKDGRTRSSHLEFTTFLFTEDEVFIYIQQFSLINPEVKESSKEYFYRDIVSINTETANYGSHVFIIKVSGGDTEKIPYGIEDSDIQQRITEFRQLIRAKKTA
jgi:hypothetical protein